MKAHYILVAMLCVLTLTLSSGCHEGPREGKQYGGFSETGTVYIQEKALSKELAVDNQQYSKLPNGALQVDTILRNRTKKRLAVECSTEFKDVGGFGVSDTTGWRVIVLQPLSGVTYTSLSTVTNAATFTVHIRPATK